MSMLATKYVKTCLLSVSSPVLFIAVQQMTWKTSEATTFALASLFKIRKKTR